MCVEAQENRLAAFANARVPVDEADSSCSLKMARHDGLNSLVRPLASRSAVVQAVRMRVLAASRGIDKSSMPMFVDHGVTIGGRSEEHTSALQFLMST